MITLTSGPPATTAIGVAPLLKYDKCVVTSLNIDVVNQVIQAAVSLTCTADASVAPLVGVLTVSINPAKASLSIPSIGFNRTITLGSTVAIATFITSTQNTIEAWLVTAGLAVGAQTGGT
jgi:hypothetical protein